jgi:hypothetical protein
MCNCKINGNLISLSRLLTTNNFIKLSSLLALLLLQFYVLGRVTVTSQCLFLLEIFLPAKLLNRGSEFSIHKTVCTKKYQSLMLVTSSGVIFYQLRTFLVMDARQKVWSSNIIWTVHIFFMYIYKYHNLPISLLFTSVAVEGSLLIQTVTVI